jgi:hypothetical protein
VGYDYTSSTEFAVASVGGTIELEQEREYFAGPKD